MPRVYRNVSTPIYLFGLELIDLLIVLLAFVAIFNVSDRFFLNFIFLVAVYIAIRIFKKGRPPGYAVHLFRFLASHPSYHVRLADSQPAYGHGSQN